MTKRFISWAAGVAVGLAVLLLVVPMFMPWSALNCEHQEVDITTGRLRFTRYLLFCKVSERTEPSSLSDALPPEVVAASTPDWRRVNTFSPGVHHSPHYIFHGAIYQIDTLAMIWEMLQMHGSSEELKKQTALHVLALWQYSGNDSLADDYIQSLSEIIQEDKRQQILSALPLLSMPLVETNGPEVTRTVFFPNGQAMERIRGYVKPSGEFTRHGVWEQWRSDGNLAVYGHFDEGDHHGRRFEWDRSGKLISIESFNRGQLSEYESENLEQHPDYKLSQQLHAREGPNSHR